MTARSVVRSAGNTLRQPVQQACWRHFSSLQHGSARRRRCTRKFLRKMSSLPIQIALFGSSWAATLAPRRTFSLKSSAHGLTAAFGQQVIVENRPGAAGSSVPIKSRARRRTATRSCSRRPSIRSHPPCGVVFRIIQSTALLRSPDWSRPRSSWWSTRGCRSILFRSSSTTRKSAPVSSTTRALVWAALSIFRPSLLELGRAASRSRTFLTRADREPSTPSLPATSIFALSACRWR